MALGLVPLETVNHACLGHAERKPILDLLLQRYVELRYQLLLLFRHVLFAIELHLEGKLSHQRLVFAARAPQPMSHLPTSHLPKSSWPSGSSTSSTMPSFTRLTLSSGDFCRAASAGNTFTRVAIEVLSASCIWLT